MTVRRSPIAVLLLALPAVLFDFTLHAGDAVPSFNDDVLPVLTRFGCNSGGCHGKLAGQNGFRLSLRGFAPDQDFEAIARESLGRRISPAAPDDSLLVLKATGRSPHGGGKRFAVDSPAARILSEWIRNGMPTPADHGRGVRATDEAVPVRLEIAAAKQVLAVGESVPLESDRGVLQFGHRRDITQLTIFTSGDTPTLPVSESGVVTAERPGETVVQAAFRGRIAIMAFTTPFDHSIDPAQYATHQNAIDKPVFDRLASLRIEPSGQCDDATFLRRASLDTIGMLPEPERIREFLADTRPDKRQRLIEELLERPEFVDYWTHWLADLLQNRKERDHDVRGTKGVRSFHTWLRERVAANRSWRDITREVLTATGTTLDQPQIGYFIVTVGEREAEQSEVADSVAQAFFGTRIGCARCHNHPLEEYTQDDYYHFIGFFSRVALERTKPEDGPTELIIGNRHLLNLRKQLTQQRDELAKRQADLSAASDDAAHTEATKQVDEITKRIESLQQQIEQTQQSEVLTRQPRTGQMLVPRPLDRSETPVAAGSDPRTVFVDWLTSDDNEHFAGAMINRLWKHFLGVGLVEPVDDLRATNPPSNPELWQLLTSEFVRSEYDLKHVMRLILNSRTYQLAADTTPSNYRDRRFYSHFQARRLPAEVLLDAIGTATGRFENFDGYPRGLRAIQIPDPFADSYFLTVFGRSVRTTACACERQDDVTLPQLLHLQNSDELAARLKSHDGRLARILETHADNRTAIDEIYLATVSRLPTEERAAIGGLLTDLEPPGSRHRPALGTAQHQRIHVQSLSNRGVPLMFDLHSPIAATFCGWAVSCRSLNLLCCCGRTRPPERRSAPRPVRCARLPGRRLIASRFVRFEAGRDRGDSRQVPPIATNTVPGVQVGEPLPQMAQTMHRVPCVAEPTTTITTKPPPTG